jgi:dihydrodipicolinate synthase/N-acetylneuraminate lyase
MVLRLIENKSINGIKVEIDDITHIIKIFQLADDTTLFVSSKTDIALAMNEIELYGYFYV